MAAHSSILPEKSLEQRSLAGSVHGDTKELDITQQVNNNNLSRVA